MRVPRALRGLLALLAHTGWATADTLGRDERWGDSALSRCTHALGAVVVAVYVDDMRAGFGRMVMCHMVADTLGELHAMADRIGVARRWYQGPPVTRWPHYDIALSKRARAVAAGAQEIKRREALPVLHRCLAAMAESRTPNDEFTGRRDGRPEA